MSSRHGSSSSMSSLSAGFAYNAAEPKPVTSTMADSSVRSKRSSRSSGGRSSDETRSNRDSHSRYSSSEGPPPPRSTADGASVARSHRSGGNGGHPARSVDGHSAQSVRSALSQGTAGRGRRARDGGAYDDDDDDRSRDTSRLMGMVNEVTGHLPGGDGGDYYGDTASRRSQATGRGSRRSEGSSRGGIESRRGSVDPADNGGYRDHGSHGSRGGFDSRDPDAGSRSARSGGAPPLPPQSLYSRGSGRGDGGYEPDGMSHEFGAHDPDGRHYAPGIANHQDRGVTVPPPNGGGGGPPSVPSAADGSRRSSRRDNPAAADEGSYYSDARSKQSRASTRGSRDSYYDKDGGEEGSIQEEGSYYSSRESRRSGGSGDRPGDRSGSGSARNEIVSTELSVYSGARRGMDEEGDEASDASRGMESNDGDSRSASRSTTKRAPPLKQKEVANDKRNMPWYNFSRCVTICVPDKCIRKDDPEAKQAWREKVAICFVVFLASSFFVGIFGFIPVFLCQERTVYTQTNVRERTNKDWVVVRGYVYDVEDLFDRQITAPKGIQLQASLEAFLHDDASRMFPRMPKVLLPDMCLNKPKFEGNEALQTRIPVCEELTEEDIKFGLPCHEFVTGINATERFMGEFHQGDLAHDGSVLLESPFTFWVSIRDRVYNVTKYVNDIRNEQTKQIEKDHPMAYLEPTLNNLVINKLNEDATELFLSVYPDDRILQCMDELFYVGIIDTRFDVVCFILNILMYFLLCFVAVIMIMQMICSLMYIAKGTRTYADTDTQDQVIIMVPCYNEGGEELIKTIDSVLGTTYPEENKVVFLLADGVVTGAGEELSTPEHLAEILGFEMDSEDDELYKYNSIGLLTDNMARVYHGYYEVEDKSLKYLVVVKHGLSMEQTGSAKPGNRGKRDSQLIVMGYFNRVYHGRELTELDSGIEDALIDLNMQSDDMRLLMTIDADTRVEELSVTHMTYAMNQNDRILALCGETKVDNKWQSWVTMMQVFEYYNNHHMKKAFESAFGCVTCLPGCFTMYRILNDDGKPLLADDHVYAEYLRNDIDSLHEQNLFHLGEDRMLTTLLLHFFPGMFLSYVPEAQCFTIVPHTLRILMSQRRRWINSTYHNLLELTKVKTMCGVCCCSMKTVVYLDLIACMILPASTIYAVYLIFLVAAGYTQFSILLLVLYGLIVGVQLVVFILRSRYDFIFWFTYFTIIGVPVFYFLLPLYAFWHMDDFSWGETRKVAAMKQSFAVPKPVQPVKEEEEEEYDSTDSGSDSEEGYSRRSGR